MLSYVCWTLLGKRRVVSIEYIHIVFLEEVWFGTGDTAPTHRLLKYLGILVVCVQPKNEWVVDQVIYKYNYEEIGGRVILFIDE